MNIMPRRVDGYKKHFTAHVRTLISAHGCWSGAMHAQPVRRPCIAGLAYIGDIVFSQVSSHAAPSAQSASAEELAEH